VDADSLTQASDFIVALARLIDRDAGRAAATPATAQPATATQRV
jgi:hypothetical protein